MKRLKKRVRSDTQKSEARRARSSTWDRNLYLAMLAVFFGVLGNYVLGDRIFLRADGLVVQDRTEIGATGLVQVSEVAVRPGQPVAEGDMLLRAVSLDALGRLADLAMRDSELVERGARLRSELALARELYPLAEARRSDIEQRAELMTALDSSRLLSADRRDAQESLEHEVEVDAVSLATRIEGLSREIAALDETRARSLQASTELRTRYSDGIHLAGTDGIVGDVVPAPGMVFNPGETLLTLYGGAPYVLAYMPTHYVFDVAVGDRVKVRAGKITRPGRVLAILPMSSSIPDEFRTAFRIKETRQLMRIVLGPGPELPTKATVSVGRDWQTERKLARLRQGIVETVAAVAQTWRDAIGPPVAEAASD